MPAKKTTSKVAAPKAAAPAPAKKAPAKKAAKKATKPAAKTAVEAAAKKPVFKKAASYEAIAHAAYLNYRRRMDLGLPGDDDTDWLEAERTVLGK